MDEAELEAALATFTSSVVEFRHWSRTLHYTEGVRFLVEQAGANWLLDHIAAHQKRARKDRRLRDAQVWVVTKIEIRAVRIACCVESGEESFHDDVRLLGEFALQSVTLHLDAETLMLPSERR